MQQAEKTSLALNCREHIRKALHDIVAGRKKNISLHVARREKAEKKVKKHCIALKQAKKKNIALGRENKE